MQLGRGDVGRGRQRLKPAAPQERGAAGFTAQIDASSLRIGDRVVAFLAPHEQTRQATWRVYLDLDLVPLAVAHEVRRPVPNRVLMPKLEGNLLEDIVHLGGTVWIKSFAPRNACEFIENS